MTKGKVVLPVVMELGKDRLRAGSAWNNYNVQSMHYPGFPEPGLTVALVAISCGSTSEIL